MRLHAFGKSADSSADTVELSLRDAGEVLAIVKAANVLVVEPRVG